MERQRTIAKSATIKGKGLHTGLDVVLEFKPAPENHGYKFQRIDLENKPIINALAENVVDTSRGTTIEENGVKVFTIEHVLSALSGLGIDNALIEINAPEIPIMDGSARFLTEALLQAGIVEQEAERKYYTLREKIEYRDDEHGIELVAYPDDHLSISVLIDYESDLLKNQFAEITDLSQFKDNISNCRTFVFFNELEKLLKNNLIKGGDLSNAIILVDQDVAQDDLDKMADIFKQPRIEIRKGNILCNPSLQFNNEPARHKLLDIIGDIALAGMPLKAKIFARRPGHHANTEFAKMVRKAIKKEMLTTTPPHYNPDKKPLLDINQIKKLLPHRNPFLLVDKILEMDHESIVGLKNVTMNESFFIGHFPNMPLMPGVLQVEAMAQVGGILILNTVPDPENYLTYFMKIQEVKFRDKVVPGDTLIFKLRLASPVRRGICHMIGSAFVGNKIVMEAELMAQIVKAK